MTHQKTFWHLQSSHAVPNDYTLLSTKLLYYPSFGFAVNVPIKQWYQKFQTNSQLQCDDWELFVDPRETTYASYTALQSRQEIHVNEILERIEKTPYDKNFSPAWLTVLENTIPVLRYPCHALQMLAAYNGQMVPDSRLVIALLFQAADEMRRVHRFAYRFCQLQHTYPNFGQKSKQQWQTDPLWQPLRKVIEKLLVVYDWGESFIILNSCLKPLFDYVFIECFTEIAKMQQDYMFAEILQSLGKDSQWHTDWSQTLIKILIQKHNKTTIVNWLQNWYQEVFVAMKTIANVFNSSDFSNRLFQKEDKHFKEFYANYLAQVGLSI